MSKSLPTGRQANIKGMSKPETELFDIETLDLIWHLKFVI
jgi:hypothetical protein